MLNISISQDMKIFCECSAEIGLKLTTFSLSKENIFITKFPKLLSSPFENCCQALDSSRQIIESLQINNEEVMKNYDKRITESKKAIRVLNNLIMKLYAKYNKKNPESMPENKECK